MKQLSHVVWNEGMHLAQHHFQAQSRFFEDTVQFALASLFYKPYGLAACELDAEALQNDAVSLVHARGVMPDGLPFDIPSSDSAVAPLSIRDLFSPTSDSHLVLLSIPAYRPDQANFASNGAATHADRAVRYTAQSVVVRDDVSGRDERPLTIGRKNFHLTLDTGADTNDGASVTLPIARVRRDGAGHFVYDTDYIPPTLHIGASPRLMSLMHRLVEILDAKADSLGRGRRGSSDDFAQREVASFWLLHAIHASAPTLRHYTQAKHVHPERLFVELARLGGALCTFSLDAHPRTLPSYDHDHPEACFGALDRHIRAHLDVAAPPRRSAIPLTAKGQWLYAGAVQDPRSFGQSRWVLGVRSSLPGHELAARFPTIAKVCSSKFVLELVKRAFPGLTLTHLPYPPASISPRSDMQYFDVERVGGCWDTIVATHEVGVYVPDSLPDIELELSIIIEGDQ
jgi:type VI secretion system protein ImpJ